MAGHAHDAALVVLPCGAGTNPPPPRHDVAIRRLRNTGPAAVTVRPTLTIDSEQPIKAVPTTSAGADRLRDEAAVVQPFEVLERRTPQLVLRFDCPQIAPAATEQVAVGVARGSGRRAVPEDMAEAEELLPAPVTYWESADLPYDRIQVPDAGVQALLDSSIRNIYQAREIKKGLPAFQVGPTCYRGLWVVDGSFLLEAVTFLGRADEARNGIHYLLSFQRDDGAIMLMDGHWKETGIALWAVTRHARLTGDKAWLREVWPQLERGFAFIRTCGR